MNQAGGRIEAVFYCPDTAESDSPCRKPNPGMFDEIAERFTTPLEDVPCVGDSLRDLQAAAAVGGTADPGAHRQGREDAGGGRAARGDASLPRPRRCRRGADRVGGSERSMVALRSALYLAILIAYTPFHWVACVLAAPLPRLTRWQVVAAWPRLATWLARRLLGIDYQVIGRNHIPPEPCVILSKHQSAWETIAYTSIFPPHVYVIKRELLGIPFLGWGLALMSPIAIDRADRKRAMQRLIELGAERLQQGFSIMVYPEGTRVAVGRRGVYKLGGAVIAANTGACALPVAHNAGLVWPRNSFLKHPGKVTVLIGPPIDSTGLTPEQLMRRVEEWIETEMERLTPPELLARYPAAEHRPPREATDRSAASLTPALSAKVRGEGDTPS